MRTVRPSIVIVNKSNGLVSDSEVMRIASACARQVEGDFAKAWGHSALVSMLRAGDRRPAPPLAWQVVIVQDEEHAKELGYADLTPQGKPLAIVCAEETVSRGDEVSREVSREILNMLGDPGCCGFERTPAGTTIAREVCDPVSGTSYRYQGVVVANFVYPAYYHAGGTGPFDQMRVIREPFGVAEGSDLLAISHIDPHAWDPETVAPAPGSRRDRRMRALSEPLESSARDTSAPMPAPARQAQPVPARREVAVRPPIQPKTFRAPLRQPTRSGIEPEPVKARVPLRQPLRGAKAEAAQALAEERAAAGLSPDSPAPTAAGKPLPIKSDAPPPRVNPLRTKKAPPASVKVIPAPEANPLRSEEHTSQPTPPRAESPAAELAGVAPASGDAAPTPSSDEKK